MYTLKATFHLDEPGWTDVFKSVQNSWCTVLIYWTLIPCQLSTGGRGNARVGDLFDDASNSDSDNDSEMETLNLPSQCTIRES